MPVSPKCAGPSPGFLSSTERRLTQSVGILLAILFSAFGQIQGAPSKLTNKVYPVFGRIHAVSSAAGTFTIKTGKGSLLLFHVTKKTRIFGKNASQKLADLRMGEEVAVAVRIGQQAEGIAVAIVLSPPPVLNAVATLFTGKTAHGETVSGAQLKELVTYAPTDEGFSTSISYGPLRPGVYLLSVRPDGTVSNIEVLNSTGYNELDERTKRGLRSWRFKPNSVVQVRVPYIYSRGFY